ncbi:GNAT family N-acetyltransferase [Thalassococcus lentus]|uniref:GNAT family N-acetyltransferase n=1 Tax=Thalassococcus lentus TaxID=1210524 RepID=A0ABT4XTB8_9RHOB|nr:GNAT family N-acetyltransferase [Thalassococcus lentus]MDA7425068.1 GNAT family N-acetyltransferase [Thalassococcus lentus]
MIAAIDGTWPAAATVEAGPWVLREGRGGGQRVSAATARGAIAEQDIGAAEKAMQLMGQRPIFMLTQNDSDLDQRLADRGYVEKDPVNLWVCDTGLLTDRKLPPVTAFAIWEPLAIMRELWEAGGIGPARLAVMERAEGPKTAIFGRVSDRPAGAAFCALYDGIAMVHAVEIAPEHRQKGLGGWMMRAAALWAAKHRAPWLAVLCTKANTGANALYASLGMQIVGDYHYRVLPDKETEES